MSPLPSKHPTIRNPEQLTEIAAKDVAPPLGPDGVPLWRSAGSIKIARETDPRFSHLADQYPDMAAWADWAHRWASVVHYETFAKRKAEGRKKPQASAARTTSGVVSSLNVFFLTYLGQRNSQGQWLHATWRASPLAFLRPLADIDAEINLRDDFWKVCCENSRVDFTDRKTGRVQSLYQRGSTLSKDVGAFLDFVASRLAASGDTLGLRNPFLTRNAQARPAEAALRPNRSSDLALSWIDIDFPRLKAWKPLACDWIRTVRRSVEGRLQGLSIFIGTYLSQAGVPGTASETLDPAVARDPLKFLHRDGKAPDTLKQCTKDKLTANAAVEFLDWVLLHRYSEPDDHGAPIRMSGLHNPLTPVNEDRGTRSSESVRSAMPYAWVDELRRVICEGPHFSDWKWAQQAQTSDLLGRGADWYEVDESVIDFADPDCVWRKRTTGSGRRNHTFYELWSPVRWVALLTKLNVPLRTMQVRVLDSGESDTWRFEYQRMAANASPWVPNDAMNEELKRHVQLAVALPSGGRARISEWSNGVLRRKEEHATETRDDGAAYTGKVEATLLHINTNKTADAKLEGAAKGFEVPIPLEPYPLMEDGSKPVFADLRQEFHWQEKLALNVYYWLSKLRDWQAKYNPVTKRTAWTELDGTGLVPTKSAEQLAMYRDTTFLFREPCAGRVRSDVPHLPIADGILSYAWWVLLKEFQSRLTQQGKTHQDGSFIRLIIDDTGRSQVAVFDLHSIRVSLITALVVEAKVPIELVQKIVGHSRIVMTVYYTKVSTAKFQEELRDGMNRLRASRAESEYRYLKSASIEQMREHMAFNDEQSAMEALGDSENREQAGWLEMPHGLCPAGGNTIPNAEVRLPGCFNGGPTVGNLTTRKVVKHAAVEGGPRNCPNCRWFITGPSYLFGLVAKFNNTAHQLDEAKKVAKRDSEDYSNGNALVYEAERRNEPQSVVAELRVQLDEAARRQERALGRVKDLMTTLGNTARLIDRCKEIMRHRDGGDAKAALVLSGGADEWQTIVQGTNSELLQLSIVAEDAEVYPELDPGKTVIRRSQILDHKLMRDGLQPVFMTLSEEDQHLVGNELMRRISKLLSPDRPTEGLLKAVKLIESTELLTEHLVLNREGLDNLVASCKSRSASIPLIWAGTRERPKVEERL